MLKLYTYFRSTAAYRVRIALQLKGLEHELVPVHLLRDGGEHKQEDYLAKNPMGLVPMLELAPDHPSQGAGKSGVEYISQSLAIMEYLEESYPQPALLPGTALARARVRAIAHGISSDIHPINNLRVLKYLTGELDITEQQKTQWYRHWVNIGFTAIERLLVESPETGLCCHGDTPTIADCCLIPQVFNADRFDCPMDDFPTIRRIDEYCKTLDAFSRADPRNQPDTE